MSTPSSIINSLRQVPIADTFSAEHQISLIDEERQPEEQEDAERNDSEAPTAPTAPTTPGPSPLTQKPTRNPSELQQSLKRQLTKRKYAKYDRDRYHISEDTPPPDEDPVNQPQVGEEATTGQVNYLERGRLKAKSFLRRKGTLGQRRNEDDTVLDILYENQRGIFFFGVPKYSSSSLLPSDPNAWENAHFRSSPVDIRNAQVPDPSWEWAWKSWYVDMSRDVDEEGWEYSFMFKGGYAWHGNHPWFHSFVRRRRWLRMRRRRDAHHHTKEKAHEFTPEYFTIHPKTVRSANGNQSWDGASDMARLREKLEEDPDWDHLEITDIGSLIHIMRRAAADREKLIAVRSFIDTAGDELYYLSDRMSDIMNLFIFQSSRRQLLSQLLQRFDALHQRRGILQNHKHDDDQPQKEHDDASRKAENIMKAVRAADEQVKKLEYWSDIKDMTHQGETLEGTSEGKWDFSRWQGLSPVSGGQTGQSAFASKQEASEGTPDLHRHPEHSSEEEDDAKSAVTAPSSKSTDDVIAVKHGAGKESSTENEGYVTAAESASEWTQADKNRAKGKARASDLDGTAEENETKAATSAGAAQAYIPSRPIKQSVQIVEPVPEPVDDRQKGGRGGGGDDS